VSEFVVDAAAAISALGRKDAVGITAHERIAEATCHAPHLIDAEVGHVLCHGERAGEISEETACTALHALPEMIDYRYPRTGWLTPATHYRRLRRTVRRSGRSVGCAAAHRRHQTQQGAWPALSRDADPLTSHFLGGRRGTKA
jgi:predicted nucleic acid-binding protein